jgi:hypothetical protein
VSQKGNIPNAGVRILGPGMARANQAFGRLILSSRQLPKIRQFLHSALHVNSACELTDRTLAAGLPLYAK